MDEDRCKRFVSLFRGNQRSFGQWDPHKDKNRAMQTIKEAPDHQRYMDHLKGVMGIGIVPIRDDGLCWWGAIDIDNHNKTADLDLVTIEKEVGLLKLPLVVCRSKSGGAHLYLFGQEPLRADMLKTILSRWMADLRIEGSDCVFPKQTKLTQDGEGKRALGNWINLPYFNAHDTDRYMVSAGKRSAFDLFLDHAEALAITQEQLEQFFGSEHSEAPPCIQRALKEGIGEGSRNEALFHITVYNRKRNPEGARGMSHAMQSEIFGEPLPFPEADKTIRSAAKKSYGYLCKKEPWQGWCDKDVCKKRKFGISESEYEILTADTSLPTFSDLTKYLNTEPVMWEIRMNGVPVMLTTEELMSWKSVRERAAEKLHIILPAKMKPSQWTDEILAGLIQKVRLEEAPFDSSPNGSLTMRMEEFLRKADLKSDGSDPKDREALLRGMPVVQVHHNERVIMFRAMDYEDYLRRMKTDIPRNRTLWHRANKQMGVSFDRIRVGQQLLSIWYIEVSRINENKFETIDSTPEY